LLPALLVLAAPAVAGESAAVAAGSINALGIDLLRTTRRPDANALLSPYSIQSALAMTYAGAGGGTRAEMAKVLHYPPDDARLHGAFAALRMALDAVALKSAQAVERQKRWGITNDPITLTVANRLFGQSGYAFRPPFLALLKDDYAAPLELLDFIHGSADARTRINAWVEDQTRRRIRNLIPEGALNSRTRLVLANAIYLKAPWADVFHEAVTQPLPFHTAGGAMTNVPTMRGTHRIGYAKRGDVTLLSVPYQGGDLQFLILLPDKADGLAGLEQELTPSWLAEGALLPAQQVILFLPKFKIEPPAMELAEALESLGMKTAFNIPAGSADFDRMAPRRPTDYLFISQVFHKAFLSLDERGTEAAAATAVVMPMGSAIEARKPIEVRVDRPFVFAIQHRPSGACLFLGHVTDPQ
jgi:serpin B